MRQQWNHDRELWTGPKSLEARWRLEFPDGNLYFATLREARGAKERQGGRIRPHIGIGSA